MDLLSYLLGKKAGGGGGEAVLINKSVTENGTYNASADSADGYKKVTVAVPNSYGASDEGKVVSNGTLVSQGSNTVTDNDTYDTTLIGEMVVNVANSYSTADEGKVVDNGALVSQSSDTVTENDTYDTTLISEMVVNVPNSYSAADEGKVVNSGALVAQGSAMYTANGTYDTTLVDAVEIAVPSVESGTYIGAGSGNIVRSISVSKKYSHFLIVSSATFSQLTTDSTKNLYMAYADDYGYTVVPIKTSDGGYGGIEVQNKLPTSYDNWRSQVTFENNAIKWAFMGNGAIASPVVGAEYKWFAW